MDLNSDGKKKSKFKKVLPFIVVVLLWAFAVYFLFLSDGGYFFRDNFVKASSSEIGEIDPKIANYEAVSKSGQTTKKAKLGVTY